MLAIAACAWPATAPAASPPRHDFQLIAGYSPASSALIGTALDRRFVIAGLLYSYTAWSPRGFSIAYSAGLLPVSVMLEPGRAVYGFGMLPVGAALHFKRQARFHPFVETLGGVLASSRPVPLEVPDATGLNFMFDFGAGIRWNLSSSRALTAGYKFLHFSNAGTTRFNPGLDNNVLYVGFSFLK